MVLDRYFWEILQPALNHLLQLGELTYLPFGTWYIIFVYRFTALASIVSQI